LNDADVVVAASVVAGTMVGPLRFPAGSTSGLAFKPDE
jgi:hypothetical protein